MKLDQESSERLNSLRFTLILGVVFIHGYGATVGFSESNIGVAQSSWYSEFIRSIISQGIARVAVPLFFLISGYLFFLGGKQCSLEQYRNKLLTRIHTLLVPFLFWNGLTLLLLAIAQSLPALQVFFPGNVVLIKAYGLADYANALLGIDRFPVAYQFWFIRDLMILVLLVPIMHLVLKIIPKVFLGLVVFVWIFEFWPISIPSSTGFLFYYIGAFTAYSKQSIFRMDLYGRQILFLYAGLLVADVLTAQCWYHSYVHKLALLLGVASALFVTKIILQNPRMKSILLWAASGSFFVFATHEPLLTMTRKGVYYFFQPHTNLVVLALYFVIPVSVVALCMGTYVILQKITPRCLSLITGGR